MHVFWAEGDGFIGYSRLNGENWSVPLEIIASPEGSGIQYLEAEVDDLGRLHVVWVVAPTGPLFYSQASAFGANDARAWSKPLLLSYNALACDVVIDSMGLVHVVYAPYELNQGVIHIASVDGEFWSEPDSVESNIEYNGWTGKLVQLAIDEQDILHMTWGAAVYPQAFPALAIYYQRSLDGGRTWSAPYDPDPQPLEVVNNRESAFKNNHLAVAVSLEGDIHLTWHQHTGQRRHRWSTDGGQTWSPAENIFPALGAAFNGYVDMAFDSAGQMHVVAPRSGVWYRHWREGSWGLPQLVDPRTPDWHHQRVTVVGGGSGISLLL
jgi:hypothetical protein